MSSTGKAPKLSTKTHVSQPDGFAKQFGFANGGDDVINRDEGTYSLNHVFDQLLEQQPRQHRVDKTGNSSRGGVTPATARSSQN